MIAASQVLARLTSEKLFAGAFSIRATLATFVAISRAGALGTGGLGPSFVARATPVALANTMLRAALRAVLVRAVVATETGRALAYPLDARALGHTGAIVGADGRAAVQAAPGFVALASAVISAETMLAAIVRAVGLAAIDTLPAFVALTLAPVEAHAVVEAIVWARIWDKRTQ
jgi:hypothetical protein